MAYKSASAFFLWTADLWFHIVSTVKATSWLGETYREKSCGPAKCCGTQFLKIFYIIILYYNFFFLGIEVIYWCCLAFYHIFLSDIMLSVTTFFSSVESEVGHFLILITFCITPNPLGIPYPHIELSRFISYRLVYLIHCFLFEGVCEFLCNDMGWTQ